MELDILVVNNDSKFTEPSDFLVNYLKITDNYYKVKNGFKMYKITNIQKNLGYIVSIDLQYQYPEICKEDDFNEKGNLIEILTVQLNTINKKIEEIKCFFDNDKFEKYGVMEKTPAFLKLSKNKKYILICLKFLKFLKFLKYLRGH